MCSHYHEREAACGNLLGVAKYAALESAKPRSDGVTRFIGLSKGVQMKNGVGGWMWKSWRWNDGSIMHEAKSFSVS